MTRTFQIYGPAMVSANFGAHVPTTPDVPNSRLYDLGLAVEPIRIELNFTHQDVKADAYGPNIPIDQQWMLADARITTRLVHYDQQVLDLCLQEAAAGGSIITGVADSDGSLAPAGSVMGGSSVPPIPLQPFFPSSGYHYVSLNIRNGNLVPELNGQLWRFPAAYLTQQPVVIPIGSERTIAELTWKAIPYGRAPGVSNTYSGGAFRIRAATSSTDLGIPIFLYDHAVDFGG